jgi:hypothetical protein
MKLKVVIVDFEMTPRAKRLALRVGIPALILGASAVAYANVPNVFVAGATLHAADLNANFASLDARDAVIEGNVATLQASLTTLQTTVAAVQSSVSTLQGSPAAPRYAQAIVNADGSIFEESGNVGPVPGGTGQPFLVTRQAVGQYNIQWSASQFPNGVSPYWSPALTSTFEAVKVTGFVLRPAASGLSGIFVETAATSGGALADEPFSIMVIGQ